MIVYRFDRALGRWLPQRYEITDLDANRVGSMSGQFSLTGRYDITIDDTSDVPNEPVVAAAVVIDAI